jgi:hypothetical protein
MVRAKRNPSNSRGQMIGFAMTRLIFARKSALTCAMLKPEIVLAEIAAHVGGLITAEIYARVSHVPMLSHYTSVEAFRSILRSRELWFSLIKDTNDTSEAVEGTKIIGEALEKYGPEIFRNYSKFDVQGNSKQGKTSSKEILMFCHFASMVVTRGWIAS